MLGHEGKVDVLTTRRALDRRDVAGIAWRRFHDVIDIVGLLRICSLPSALPPLP